MPYQNNQTNKRKHYTSQFKFERAVEAIKKDNLSEISCKYVVGVNVLSKLKFEEVQKFIAKKLKYYNCQRLHNKVK